MFSRSLYLSLAVLLVVVVGPCSAFFYLPGIPVHEFEDNAQVDLFVNSLDSIRTQMPYDYYSLPWTKSCKPKNVKVEHENLGQILAGDKIEQSLYQINMVVSEPCKILCRTDVLSTSQLKEWEERIEEEYRVNWIIDNLPAAQKKIYIDDSDGGKLKPIVKYERGFPLGYSGADSSVKYINNHVKINVKYHIPDASKGKRIVGFEVDPYSVKHKLKKGTKWNDEELSKNELTTCEAFVDVSPTSPLQPVTGLAKDDRQIIFTYDVNWEKSNIRWASRWDIYLNHDGDSQIHWFSIFNSIMIVLFLAGMIAVILMRTLRRDMLMYNQLTEGNIESVEEETGWKLVHGEVFRPPQHAKWMSIFVGTGVQVFFMVIFTLLFAVLGFLSPATRGSLMMALLLLYVFMGFFNGYFSTRVYKMFKLTEWRANTFHAALFYPGVVFGVFFILNLFLWYEESTGAVPFSSLLSLVILWFGISTPLVYVGSYFAYKKPAHDPPISVNHIPRMIPEQEWYMQSPFAVLVGGILPFGAVFIEVFFIMTSVWHHQFYYMFPFLLLVFLILTITCAEITVVMVYFQLCSENYHWWWRAFFTSGSSAFYLFIYSFLYYFTGNLNIEGYIATLLYFSYMFIASFTFFIVTGSLGLMSTYAFVYKIYSSIKID